MYFKKVGRRYVPVADSETYDALHEGRYLITVGKGCKTTTTLLDGQEALSCLAALHDLAQLVTDEVVEQSKGELPRATTPKERRAVKAYCDVMGEDAVVTIWRKSAAEVGRRVAEKVVGLADAPRPPCSRAKKGTK